MNIENAKILKEKLDAIQKVAEEYGTQAEQFQHATKDVVDCASKIDGLNNTAVELINKCDEYLKTTDSLIRDELTKEISRVLDGTDKAVTKCKEQCEDVSKKYNEIINTLDRQIDESFKSVSESLSLNIDNSYEKIAKEINPINESVKSLFEVINAEKEKLNLSIEEQSKTIQVSLEDLKNKMKIAIILSASSVVTAIISIILAINN